MQNDDMEAGPGKDRAWLRSYGRRRGRKLSDRQSALLNWGLDFCKVDLVEPVADLPRIFAEPVSEVWLEIGFGAGEHLVWQAEHNPHAGIVGAEPYVNGVVAALSAVETRKLAGRVKVHPDDVLALLNWLPAGSLSRAFVLFPDPWPKKRHRERRLFSPHTLNKLARLLRPGAELRFASDIADYAEAAIELGKTHPDFELTQVFTSANRDTVPDWPITRYEQKAQREGRPARFIILRRKG
jgi:tRNA (guanine-N7-)-methyltransferase